MEVMYTQQHDETDILAYEAGTSYQAELGNRQ